MISEPLQTLRGSGYLPTFNRSPGADSPLCIRPVPHRETPPTTSPEHISPPRPSPEAAREEAIRLLSRGVGISYAEDPSWSQRPWKMMSGCSGVIGI